MPAKEKAEERTEVVFNAKTVNQQVTIFCPSITTIDFFFHIYRLQLSKRAIFINFSQSRC